MTKNEELRSQWQPIETAPKDQTVMVWWGEGCWWGRKSRTIPVGAVFPKGPYAWTVKFGDGLRVADPTHWMPLPQPPTNATAQPSEELRSVKALREIAVELTAALESWHGSGTGFANCGACKTLERAKAAGILPEPLRPAESAEEKTVPVSGEGQ